MADYGRMIHRHLAGPLRDALADTPAVLINGARQTGKSTLVQSTDLASQDRQYLTFDDPGIVAAARRDPNGFIAGLNLPVTLDEIQHVPELFPVIKAAIERLKTEGSLAGSVLDNFVLMELRKQCSWSAIRPELFYWRTASGQEVDFVIEDRTGKVVGIDVKPAATLGSNDVRGLKALADAVGKSWVRGVVLYPGTEVIPFAANLHGVPLKSLWSE